MSVMNIKDVLQLNIPQALEAVLISLGRRKVMSLLTIHPERQHELQRIQDKPLYTAHSRLHKE